MRCVWVGLMVCGVLGCSSKNKERDSVELQDGGIQLENAPRHRVAIQIDQKKVAQITSTDLPRRRLLNSFLPDKFKTNESLNVIDVKSAARSLTIEPKRYPDATIEVYVENATLCIGVFRSVPKNAPDHVRQHLAKPHLMLCDVELIDIKTKYEEPSEPVAFKSLQFKLNEEVMAELGIKDFEKLPRVSDFHTKRKNKERMGEQYQLASVIKLISPLRTISHVSVHTATKSLKVSLNDLRSNDVRPLLKRNRRGVWNYRLYKRENPKVHEELRGVIRVEAR